MGREWRFERGVTPLSQWWAPVVGLLAYAAVVLLLPRALRGRKLPAGAARALMSAHNLALCAASGAMFAGLAAAVWADAAQHGLVATLCRETRGTLGGVWVWCYLFYLSKYWELFDTLLLVLAGKPLSVLHVFHHAAVLPVFWMLLDIDATNQWLPALLNTGVHVPMYYHFFAESLAPSGALARALPSLRRFRRAITRAQIAQFYADIAIVLSVDVALPACRARLSELFRADAWALAKCLAFFALPAALIVLFTRFYRQAYAPDAPRKRD